MFERDRTGDAQVIALPIGRAPKVAEVEESVRTGLVAQVRANARVIAAAQAEQLRLVAKLADWVTGEAVADLAALGHPVAGTSQGQAVIDAALEGELQAVLGIPAGPAGRVGGLGPRRARGVPAPPGRLGAGRRG